MQGRVQRVEVRCQGLEAEVTRCVHDRWWTRGIEFKIFALLKYFCYDPKQTLPLRQSHLLENRLWYITKRSPKHGANISARVSFEILTFTCNRLLRI